jgi:hypothetical protein
MERHDLNSFAVRSAVVHYVPTERDDPGDEVLLTDSAIDLDAGLRRYFESKIVDRLQDKGLEVIGDRAGDQTVANAVATTEPQDSTLVESSQAIVRQLVATQSTKVSPSGLLAIVSGTVGPDECLAILKLERERGIHFAIKRVGGHNFVDLELLRDLTLTDKTRVYKTALLIRSEAGIEGFVADDQRGISTGRQVATFFLSRFLGCEPKVPAALLTYEFVKAANEAINEDVDSPERRGRYQVAVLATLQSNAPDIRPSQFASQHLEKEDREPFLARVRAAGIDTDVAFEKDTSRVKVSRFRMSFRSGMVLVGDQDALDNHVTLPDKQEDGGPVILNDRVEDLLAGR